MKLLTLNCHAWQEENQLEKIKYLAKVISEEDFDVIALQEVSQLINDKKGISKDNYVSILLKDLEDISKVKYNYVWDMSHIGYDKYEEGIAIITKHKIKQQDSFYISKNTDINEFRSRKIVKARITIDEKDYDFYSCHLGWWQDEIDSFENQADNLLKRVDENILSFFMGDFNNNAFIRNEGYDYLLEKGLKDTFKMAEERDEGITAVGEIDGWGKNKDNKRLDLILTNKAIEVIKSQVIFNDINKKIVSDHYGVKVITK